MNKEQAYEKLELPVGADLQLIRQKFMQMHNDFQVQIDGSFSTQMRQRKEQQLEELKEAFALLNESTGVDDSAFLPHTEKTFDHQDEDLKEPLHAKLTIKAPKDPEKKMSDLLQALAIFGLRAEQDAMIIVQTMQQHIAELSQQKEKSPLAGIKEAYGKAISEAESARMVVDKWLYVRQAEDPTAREQSPDEQCVKTSNTGDDTPTTAKKQSRLWIYVLFGLLSSIIGYFLFIPTADTGPVIADHPADTPKVAFPDVVYNKVFVEAVSILRNHSLLIGDTTYVDDVAKDLVLEARLDGQPIRSGSMVPKQSEIDLVLGNGKGFDEIAVPDLIGLSYVEAKFGISGLGLTLGNTDYNGNPQHSPDAKVIGQSPKAGQSVSLGTKINLTLAAANNKPKNVEALQVAPVEETANELNTLASEISFEYDSSRLTPRSYNALDEICSYMRSEGGRYDLIIHLHEGETEAYNRRLAQDKGDALKQYLINNGVSSGMLTVIAKGNSVQKWRGDKPRFLLEIRN